MIGDPLRLALGTLTVVRVPPPRSLDRRVAGRAMLLAPVAALPLAVLVGGLCWLGHRIGTPPLVCAGVAIGALAAASRGMHLDGLADCVDGLAASYDRERALDVMRRGDVGPAGASALVLVLLVQVGALAAVVGDGGWRAAAWPAAAVLASRGVLPLACRRGVPAARPEGLGATVAGSVGPSAVVLGGAGLLVAVALLGRLGDVASGGAWHGADGWWAVPLAAVVGLVAAQALLARCTRRLGGVTGDVLGALVEVALAAALVVLATAA